MTKIDIVSSVPVEEKREEFLAYYLGATPEEAEETYKEFSWLINIMAQAYAKNSKMSAEYYFAEAITGLARAKRDWDSTRGGCQFKTFAVLKIKNALNEYCRKSNSIVVIPYYVRTAHTYITNVRTILEGHGMTPQKARMILNKGLMPWLRDLPRSEISRVQEELDKLKRLARNSEVPYKTLIERGEFIPLDMAYDEGMSQEELFKREQQRLAAALMVSRLEDHMTDEELHVARGIMAGHSYGEIGRSHDPKRSIAWVLDKVNEMRDKFKAKLKEGL